MKATRIPSSNWQTSGPCASSIANLALVESAWSRLQISRREAFIVAAKVECPLPRAVPDDAGFNSIAIRWKALSPSLRRACVEAATAFRNGTPARRAALRVRRLPKEPTR